jgi:hypothetical protein
MKLFSSLAPTFLSYIILQLTDMTSSLIKGCSTSTSPPTNSPSSILPAVCIAGITKPSSVPTHSDGEDHVPQEPGVPTTSCTETPSHDWEQPHSCKGIRNTWRQFNIQPAAITFHLTLPGRHQVSVSFRRKVKRACLMTFIVRRVPGSGDSDVGQVYGLNGPGVGNSKGKLGQGEVRCCFTLLASEQLATKH